MEAVYIIDGNVNGAVTMETIWRFSKKLKVDQARDPANPLLGKCFPKLKSGCWRDIHGGIISVHSGGSIDTTQVSIDGWVDKANGV